MTALVASAAALHYVGLRITSHCFRVSVASHLSAAGIHTHLIKHLCRWRSDTFLAYIRDSTAPAYHIAAAFVFPDDM